MFVSAELIIPAKNKTIAKQTLTLDGATLIDSKFRNCTFVYSGLLPVSMVGCEFYDCRWEFSGPAKQTLGFLEAMHSMGGGCAKLVETTFNKITKKGAVTNEPTLH